MTRNPTRGLRAFAGARVFDGNTWHENAALLVEGPDCHGPVSEVPSGARVIRLAGGFIAPGFVDLQVNGGGGVLLNEAPTLDGIRAICDAHARFGATALLPTLISGTAELVGRAIAAGIAATESGVPGFLGLHIEGPHLSPSRRGAHAAGTIRPMSASDLLRLCAAAARLPVLLVTVAPDVVTPGQIEELTAAGAIVSLGHSDATYGQAEAAADAGARLVTHLFNAMSPLGSREPGLVGAALAMGALSVGLIADGIHVDPVSMGIALRAKSGPGHVFLISDAMGVAGTNLEAFELHGRTVTRHDGALRLTDGTLAGADLTMIGAVSVMHHDVGLPLEEALRMAALYPAAAIGGDARLGHLRSGAAASFVHVSHDLGVLGTWIEGEQVFAA